jgi:hypothetical protein
MADRFEDRVNLSWVAGRFVVGVKVGAYHGLRFARPRFPCGAHSPPLSPFGSLSEA